MKKRLWILASSLLALTAIPGCGFSTGAATTSKEAVVTSNSLIETSSKSDQGMVIVEIPGDMIGNNPDAFLEKIKSNDIKVEKNESGGVRYHLTKKQYAQMLKLHAGNIRDMLANQSYPYITEITTNDDFSVFTIKTKSPKPGVYEKSIAKDIFVYAKTYHVFAGQDVTMRADIVNAETGEAIDSCDSSDQ